MEHAQALYLGADCLWLQPFHEMHRILDGGIVQVRAHLALTMLLMKQ